VVAERSAHPTQGQHEEGGLAEMKGGRGSPFQRQGFIPDALTPAAYMQRVQGVFGRA
jgi:hypothetical protein